MVTSARTSVTRAACTCWITPVRAGADPAYESRRYHLHGIEHAACEQASTSERHVPSSHLGSSCGRVVGHTSRAEQGKRDRRKGAHMDTEGEGGRGGKGQRASVNHTPARHAAQLTSEPLPAKNQLERSSQAVRGESRAQRGNEPPACASSASLSSTAMRDPRFAREKRLPSSSAIALCDLSLLPHPLVLS